MGWQQDIGLLIREARESAGHTQQWLAKEIGKSRNMVGRYEAGKDTINLDIFAKIATALKMPAVTVNGCHLSIQQSSQTKPSPAEQCAFEFDKEYTFPDATLKIKPGRVEISIHAVAPTRKSP